MMQSTLPVTVYLMTNRVDQRLAAALQSVAWASEIILGLQGGAQPKPAQLTAWQVTQTYDLGAQPIKDFAQARESLMSLGTQPWIFWLDSDEVVPAETVHQLASLLSQSEVAAWSFRRVDVFADRTLRWGELYHQDLVRLYRRDQGQWTGSVHETVSVKGQTRFSGLELTHYPHPTCEAFWQSLTQYAEIAASSRVAAGQPWSWWQLAYPVGKWWYLLIWRQAWRDGWPGMVYAVFLSLHSFTVRVLWWEKTHAVT